MATDPFTVYSGSDLTALAGSLLGASSGIVIDPASISLSASGASAVNYYDGSLTALGIGAGLLLTSGTTPGTSNTVGWFGQDNTLYAPDGTPLNFNNGDPTIDAVVNTVFQTQSYDATTLAFNFTVADPAATSISFDLVFGSDEYPEWVDQFVDCAVIVVNGVNYALFNHDPNAPLSVIGPNLASGYFQDNAGNVLPIEYDGVSHVLKIVAPINGGQVNSIRIGIADTGDHIYDSGIFIANLTAGNTPGSGVVITPDVPCTDGSDVVNGTAGADLIDLKGGDDIAYAGIGDDIVVAGAGNDKVYGGSGEDTLEGDEGNDLLDGGQGVANTAVYAGKSSDYAISYDAATGVTTVTDLGGHAKNEGADQLLNIEHLKFSDGLFDLKAGVITAHVDSTGATDQPGAVAVAGIAVPGHVLTAIVTDPDALPADPAAIAYAWLVSADGVNWTDTGVTAKTFTLGDGQAGLSVMASASYVDGKGVAELVQSGAVTVAAPTGALAIELMVLDTPAGGTVANPLTTLLKNAVDLGFTPASAEAAIKAALGLPDIDLRTYDAYAVLSANPTDPTAVAVMKIATEVAMTASVSDPTGYNLALAVIGAADAGAVLDLANATTLDSLLAGIDPALIDIVKTLNKDMANDAHSLSGIVTVWNDYTGQTDQLAPYMNHLQTLSVHINQAPTGWFTGDLAHGTQDQALTITAADLLTGFTAPEGAALTVTGVFADVGGSFVDTGDGTFTFTPDAGYAGPVEISYAVADPLGAEATGHALLVIDAAAVTDTTAPEASLSSDFTGVANGEISFTLTFSEVVTGLDASAFTVSHGTVTGLSGGGTTFTVTVAPDAGFEGTLDLTLDAGTVTDLAGNALAAPVLATQAIDTLAPSATITDDTAGTATGKVIYTVTFAETVTGLDAADFTVANGAVTHVSGSGASYAIEVTPDAGVEGVLSLSLMAGAVTDLAGNANAAAAAADQAIDTPAPTVATFTPPDASAGVATGANLVVTFSEAVAIGSGTISIRQGAPDGAVVESFAAGSPRLSVSGATLTIDPTVTLLDSTHYYVVFSSGSVVDLAGNAYAGSATWDFTTAAAQPLNLVGTAGVDTLTGGAANDTLNGLGSTDHLDGRDGSDLYLIASAAEHSAAEITDTGTSGIDEVRFTSATAATLTLFSGDTGLERATVAAGTTALSINTAAVQNGLTLVGNAGANTLTGTAFADVLMGGLGNDTLDGGAGNDTASYADMTAAVTVSLAITKAQATAGAGSDLLKNIENLVGGSGADTLTGNSGDNRLEGGAGNDSLDGGAGNDRLLGGDGADNLAGGAGADQLWGGAGADLFVFKALAESTGATADSIYDFSHADGDRIDLHLIDAISGGKDNAFSLVSTFSHKAGELVATFEVDHYIVQGDVNGDGLADMAINVYAAAPLVAGDFVL